MQLLFAATLFVSALLLFLVQPMVGKIILPLAGGTPAVWNTCMVFFQGGLLAGYLYAHAGTTRIGTRRFAGLHALLLILPLAALAVVAATAGRPLAPLTSLAPHGQEYPFFGMIAMLAALVGLPFFFLATSAPLLQRWFADTDAPSARDPYFLYAASNLGSFLGLLLYPLLLERQFTLRMQAWVWFAGLLVWVGLTWRCAAALLRSRPPAWKPRPGDSALDAQPIDWTRRLRWVGLAAVPSSLMLSVTTYATTDLAPIPLFLVVPLGIYLLTFVVAFGLQSAWPFRLAAALFPVFLLMILFMRGAGIEDNLILGLRRAFHEAGPDYWWLIGYHLLVFTLIALGCHFELARTRPPAVKLTEFYLWVSLGGVLGGLFNAFIAPNLFNDKYEYIVGLLAACYLVAPGRSAADRSARSWRNDLLIALALGAAVFLALKYFAPALEYPPLRWLAAWLAEHDQSIWVERLRTVVCFGVPALICFLFVDRPVRFGLATTAVYAAGALAMGMNPQTDEDTKNLLTARSFFGVLKVDEIKLASGGVDHKLVHGSTVHGLQHFDPPSDEPLTYYHRTGPVGDIFANTRAGRSNRPLGFVGLGTGSLTAYGQPGQSVTVYEIDPLVRRIAEDPKYFTYLSEAKKRGVNLDIVMGDARLRLAEAPDGKYAVLAVDAFSSDSIPIHLLTREAVQLYFDKLAPDGVLALHVSNRYLELDTVAARIAADLGLVAYEWYDRVDGNSAPGKYSSHWIALARKEADLGELPMLPGHGESKRWTPMTVGDKPGPLWTDDFSNVLSVLAGG